MEKRITFKIKDRLEKVITEKSKRKSSIIELKGVFAERVSNVIEWGDALDLQDAIVQGLWLLTEKSYKKNCNPIPDLEACD